MSAAKIKYPNPPIQEALCEVHFDIADPLSRERVESLKPLWAGEFPDQKTVAEQNVKVLISPEGIKTDALDLGHRLICRSADGKRLVQLSGRFLAVNQLSPYPGWEEAFRDNIRTQTGAFLQAVGSLKIKRLGLRYINKIDIPEHPFVWSKWFRFDLPVPTLADAEVAAFQMQFQQRLGGQCRLVTNVAALPPTPEQTSPVILDLDVVWEGDPADSSRLPDLLELVHQPVGLAFESYLSDKLRELFNQRRIS